jgi:hypothetical protein
MQGFDSGFQIGMPSGAAHRRNHSGSGIDGDGRENSEMPHAWREIG